MVPARLKLIELRRECDEELMERCAAGSHEAFHCLVERYRGRLINVVGRFINDRDRAEDIVQEVFLRVYRSRHRYKRQGRFSTWIFTIAVNLAKNEIRRKVRRRGEISLDALEEATGPTAASADGSPGAEEKLRREQLKELVAQAIASLPVKYREAVVLRDIEGMAYDEIASVLRIPGGTVRSRINRGRLMIKDFLTPFLSGKGYEL
jgi:RNA polymerase sigma-70 factor (ECF subfamily)